MFDATGSEVPIREAQIPKHEMAKNKKTAVHVRSNRARFPKAAPAGSSITRRSTRTLIGEPGNHQTRG
jgi:hypothetical protein